MTDVDDQGRPIGPGRKKLRAVHDAIVAGVLHIPPTVPDPVVVEVADPKNPTDFEASLVAAITRSLTFRGPRPTMMVTDEAAEFSAQAVLHAAPPTDTEGNPLDCDRCSGSEGVSVNDSCAVCGPTPLCVRCTVQHHSEARITRALEDDNPNIVKGLE